MCNVSWQLSTAGILLSDEIVNRLVVLFAEAERIPARNTYYNGLVAVFRVLEWFEGIK
jgi:hypothetical protein